MQGTVCAERLAVEGPLVYDCSELWCRKRELGTSDHKGHSAIYHWHATTSFPLLECCNYSTNPFSIYFTSICSSDSYVFCTSPTVHASLNLLSSCLPSCLAQAIQLS